MIHDIAIIGAGPAGAMAAHKLEELGVEYTLLDEAEFPRNKPCAGKPFLLLISALARAPKEKGSIPKENSPSPA